MEQPIQNLRELSWRNLETRTDESRKLAEYLQGMEDAIQIYRNTYICKIEDVETRKYIAFSLYALNREKAKDYGASESVIESMDLSFARLTWKQEKTPLTNEFYTSKGIKFSDGEKK